MGHALIVPGADYRSKNLGTVTPTETLALQGIVIMGPSTAFVEQRYDALLVPTFTTQRSVTWSIVSGGQYATIDQNGTVTASPDLSSTSITIRCTSNADSDIYAEKTITISSVSIEYFDYITSDGTDCILHPGAPYLDNGKVVLVCTMDGANTYTFLCWRASNSTVARLGAYVNGSNLVSAAAGSTGYYNIATKANIVYRFEYNLSTVSGGASFYLYNNDTDAVIGSKTSIQMDLNAIISIFDYTMGEAGSIPTKTSLSLPPSGSKIYSLVITDGNNNKVLEFKPAKYYGKAGLYEAINNQFYGGYFDTGGIIAGDDE